MGFSKHTAGWIAIGVAAAMGASSCGFHHAKYDNPIANNSQQPDKVLFDKAMHDIEKGRYEIARLTLNTLINTYDTSEYLAKAKLAIADSWYREGGITGLTQAEADYKEFELFYPTMAEAAEAQKKICLIHFNQMDKPDRDLNQALRAESECRQLLIQYPNSQFAIEAEQKLREIQEVLAQAEMNVGTFQHQRGDWAAAANRFTGLVEQYPLYSGADEALWLEADSYSHMGSGNRFRTRAGDALAKLVRDYPLSPYTDQAKKKLLSMELPVPDADPNAVARMRYELQNRTKPSLLHRATGFIRSTPETSAAAKTGAPQMGNPKQNIPVSVPTVAADGTTSFTGDVTVAPATPDTTAAPQPTPATQPAPAPNTNKQNKR